MIDVNKMKRIGVITIAPDRISKKDADSMQSFIAPTLTSSFFYGMRPTKDVYSKRDIVKMGDNKDSVFAYLDNDAIFLVSEKPILSPTDFVNAMVALQKHATSMNEFLRTVPRRYSMLVDNNNDFGLGNLNINFVDLKLATGMPLEVVNQYAPTEEAGKSSISTKFDLQNSVFLHSHTSQNGINVVDFLDGIIATNPDMGLLMSNVMCEKKSVILDYVEAFLYGDVSLDSDISLGSLLRQANEGETLEAGDILLEKCHEHINKHRENNAKYREYPVIQAVVKKLGKIKDMNVQYVMSGDNTPSDKATIEALNTIAREEKSKDGSKCCPLRLVPEVESYKVVLDLRARELSRKMAQGENTRDQRRM